MSAQVDVNNVKNWSQGQLLLMQWLALPKAERVPKTQKLLAIEIDVSEKTLCEWKRLPGFADEVIRLSREYVKDAVPEVLAALRRKAAAGSIPHIDRILAMAGLADDVEAAGKGQGSQVSVIFEAEVRKAYSNAGSDPEQSE